MSDESETRTTPRTLTKPTTRRGTTTPAAALVRRRRCRCWEAAILRKSAAEFRHDYRGAARRGVPPPDGGGADWEGMLTRAFRHLRAAVASGLLDAAYELGEMCASSLAVPPRSPSAARASRWFRSLAVSLRSHSVARASRCFLLVRPAPPTRASRRSPSAAQARQRDAARWTRRWVVNVANCARAPPGTSTARASARTSRSRRRSTATPPTTACRRSSGGGGDRKFGVGSLRTVVVCDVERREHTDRAV